MRHLNGAYHVISDPERRSRYDAYRARASRGRARASTSVVPPSAGGAPPALDRATPSAMPYGARLALVLTALALAAALLFAAWLVLDVLKEEAGAPTGSLPRSSVNVTRAVGPSHYSPAPTSARQSEQVHVFG